LGIAAKGGEHEKDARTCSQILVGSRVWTRSALSAYSDSAGCYLFLPLFLVERLLAVSIPEKTPSPISEEER